MIQAKCIQKFRDKNNHIYGYRLQDLNGQTQDVKPENLKQAIMNKEINVINLTLTSDMRLVDKSEDKLKSPKLGEEPAVKADNKLLKIAKILCDKCSYTIDKNDTDEDCITVRKNGKIATYMSISGENIINVTLGSDDFAFEKSIKLHSKTDIEKIYNLDKLINNCNTPEEILKVAVFIGNNLGDGFAENELDSILNKLYSIYGLKEETENLIQLRINKLIKNNKQLTREEIIKQSKYICSYTYKDNEEDDASLITETIKAGIWYTALSGESLAERAIYSQQAGAYKKYSYEGIQSTKKQNNAINLFDKMPDIIIEAAEKLDNVMEFALCRDRGEDDDFNDYTMEILGQMVDDYAILINYTNNYNSIYDIETDVIKKSNDKFRSLRHWALALLILDKNINNIIQNILNKHNTDGDFRALVFLTDEYFNKTDDDAKYGIMNWYGYMYDWDDTDNEYIESLNYLIKFFKNKENSYMVNLMKQCKEFISNIPDEYKDL